jgi:GT2 family glycosyltransferase
MANLKEIVFVMAPRQNRFFFELAEALRYEIQSLGTDCSISTGGFPPSSAGRVSVLMPPHEYFALEGYDTGLDRRTLKRTIFISAEQPGTSHFEDNARLAESAGALFDINRSAVRQYDRRGIRALHLQLGYSPTLDFFPGEAQKEFDVVFMGAYTSRRARILAGCGQQLSGLRARLTVSDNSRPNSSSSASYVAGLEKASLLRRAAVMVNVHQSGFPYFEWARVLDAIHCGCAVVTEHSMDCLPLVPGEHFASASAERLGDVVEWVAMDPETRWRLSSSAYELVKAELPLARSAEKLVAAAIEIDRTGGYLRSVMGTALPGARFSRRGNGAESAVLKEVVVPPTPYRQDPETAELRRVLKEARLDIIDLRRAVHRAELASGTGSPPGLVRVGFGSPSWHAGGRPKVSVIMALYNYAAEVIEALDSVLASRMTDTEVVVVDDGSSDGAAQVVTGWASAHPEMRLLMVEHPVNRGLAAARNAALDFARGEYCFVLDADNWVYPNSLEVLARALDDAKGAAFAYGYLAMYMSGEPFGLLSWYPWEPLRLRAGNYIDAMALFRTEVLRELGGYSSDRRLYGWEDYDLYCRLAESGRHGEFVPQIVGRYRVSPASMRSLSDLSYNSAFAALKEHCPQLMEAMELPL